LNEDYSVQIALFFLVAREAPIVMEMIAVDLSQLDSFLAN